MVNNCVYHLESNLLTMMINVRKRFRKNHLSSSPLSSLFIIILLMVNTMMVFFDVFFITFLSAQNYESTSKATMLCSLDCVIHPSHTSCRLSHCRTKHRERKERLLISCFSKVSPIASLYLSESLIHHNFLLSPSWKSVLFLGLVRFA